MSKYILIENYEIHNTLNPKLWNDDNTLKIEVKDKLNDIAEEFLKYIDIALNIVDIEIVGSNASYNYNDNSDLDLHFIVNNEINYMDTNILQQLFNSKKNSFNEQYDLDIYGIKVETYIENILEGNATAGRYSIIKNIWISEPARIDIDLPNIAEELSQYKDKCNAILQCNDADKVLEFYNEIYMMRKLSLSEKGEYSTGNLIFKELRNADILSQIKDHYYELKSKKLSLNESPAYDESFNAFKEAISLANRSYPSLQIKQSSKKETTYWFKYDNVAYSINYAGPSKLKVSKLGTKISETILIKNNRFDEGIKSFIQKVKNNKF